MIKREGNLGLEASKMGGAAQGVEGNVARSGDCPLSNVIPFDRARATARGRAVHRRGGLLRGVHHRRDPSAAHDRHRISRVASIARHEGPILRAMSVDAMPWGVRVRFLTPGKGRREHLCLIHDGHSGDIVAFGYGRDRAAARFAACKDLQVERRAKVTLGITVPTVGEDDETEA